MKNKIFTPLFITFAVLILVLTFFYPSYNQYETIKQAYSDLSDFTSNNTKVEGGFASYTRLSKSYSIEILDSNPITPIYVVILEYENSIDFDIIHLKRDGIFKYTVTKVESGITSDFTLKEVEELVKNNTIYQASNIFISERQDNDERNNNESVDPFFQKGENTPQDEESNLNDYIDNLYKKLSEDEQTEYEEIVFNEGFSDIEGFSNWINPLLTSKGFSEEFLIDREKCYTKIQDNKKYDTCKQEIIDTYGKY